MSRFLRAAAVVALLALPSMAAAQATTDLDAFWAELARTVEEGDFEGYAALYHPDAVLVMQGSGTVPIENALAAWKQGFDDTRAGKAAASVEFRFTSRLNDPTTAHESGMFRYTMNPDEGDPVVALVRFDALLVKRNGEWLMVMEYQKDAASEEDWAAAG